MDLNDDGPYKDLDIPQHSDFMDSHPAVKGSLPFRSIVLGCIGSFAFAGFLISILRVPWSGGDVGEYAWTDCGTTGEQARARGCNYAPMGRYWAPPECSFPEDYAEFQPFRDRGWYSDTNLTIPVDPTGLESGDTELGYTQYWHDEHCTYVLRNLAMSVARKQKMVTSLVGSAHHINHCSRSIVAGLKKAYNESFLANDNGITESRLGFMGCVPLKDISPTLAASDSET